MNVFERAYAEGTCLRVSYPWGLFHGGRVKCADGKVRAIKRIAQTADTFYSIPAAVAVRGRTVAGYVTFDYVNDEYVARFVANAYGRNAELLPQ